ncbi:MAG: HEAT repeat domain-containing protein [Planctomycetota bacterium]|nr:HEAT repeat domain-containing protein [Planctomycetota bacterium]
MKPTENPIVTTPAVKRERVFRGQPVSTWIAQLDSTSPTLRLAALRRLDALRSRTDISEALPGIVRRLKDPDTGCRLDAVLLLAKLGSAAKAGKEDLLRIVRDSGEVWDLQPPAIEALGNCGPEVADEVLPIVKPLAGSPGEYSAPAMRTLAKLGPRGVEVLGELLRTFTSMQTAPPVDLVRALGYSGKHGVPLLVSLLKHEAPHIRRLAARALGQIGPAASGALTDLRELRQRKDDMVPAAATAALLRIEPKGPHRTDALSMLIEALNTRDEELRIDAVDGLAVLGKEAVPKLLEAFQMGSPVMRESAAEALARIGPDADAAVPTLIDELKNEQAPGRAHAIWVLSTMGSKAKAAVPELARIAGDAKSSLRSRAIIALGRIGPDAEAAVPLLRQAASGKDRGISSDAQDALDDVQPVWVEISPARKPAPPQEF